MGKAIDGRGRDLNDALGTLPGFAKDAGDVLEVLDVQQRALGRLVKNTGVVFGALTENESQLRNLITGSAKVFGATAARDDSLAETIRIVPTFLDESRLTLDRLKTFAGETDPLIRDLRPVARDLQPTVRDVRALSPDLERTFRDLDPLIKASKTGLPALRQTLAATRPMLGELGPFLSQLNPILEFLEVNQGQVAEFIGNGAAAVADTTYSPSGGVGHYLRQIGPTGAESAAMFRERLSSNRGNTYLPPLALSPSRSSADRLIWPNWDCKPSGGERGSDQSSGGRTQGCFVAGKYPWAQLQGNFPRVGAADYSGK
jgi:ABC-type transporter Mla subunit MlaD